MHILTFTTLAEFPARLNAHLRALPLQDPAGAEPAQSEKDALSTLLDSVLSFETLFHTRLNLMLEKDRSVLDLDAAHESQGATSLDPFDRIATAFEAARKRTLSVLGDLTEVQWARQGTLDGVEVTVIGLVHLLTAHDLEQLADLQRRLAARNAL